VVSSPYFCFLLLAPHPPSPKSGRRVLEVLPPVIPPVIVHSLGMQALQLPCNLLGVLECQLSIDDLPSVLCKEASSLLQLGPTLHCSLSSPPLLPPRLEFLSLRSILLGRGLTTLPEGDAPPC
jgi:hypothetical protein